MYGTLSLPSSVLFSCRRRLFPSFFLPSCLSSSIVFSRLFIDGLQIPYRPSLSYSREHLESKLRFSHDLAKLEALALSLVSHSLLASSPARNPSWLLSMGPPPRGHLPTPSSHPLDPSPIPPDSIELADSTTVSSSQSQRDETGLPQEGPDMLQDGPGAEGGPRRRRRRNSNAPSYAQSEFFEITRRQRKSALLLPLFGSADR